MERRTKTPTTSEGQRREIWLRDAIRDTTTAGRHQAGVVATLAALARDNDDHDDHDDNLADEHYVGPAGQRVDAAGGQSCYCYCLNASLKFIGLTCGCCCCCCCWRRRRRRRQLIRSSKCERIVSKRRPRGRRRRPAEVSAVILVVLLLLLGVQHQQHQSRQPNGAGTAVAAATPAPTSPFAPAAGVSDEDFQLYAPPSDTWARSSREAAQIRDSGPTNVVLENNNQNENTDDSSNNYNNNNNNSNNNNDNDNDDEDDDEASDDESSSSSSSNNDDSNNPDEPLTDGDADSASNYFDVQDTDTSSAKAGSYLNKKLQECEARNLRESQAAEKAAEAAHQAANGTSTSTSTNDNANTSTSSMGNGSGASGPNLIGGIREELLETIFQWVIYSIFGTLFLIGTSTNALTLYAVGRKRTLTPMDIYIIMLAINDLIYCLLALPIPVLYVLYYGEWVFGLFTCKMAAFLTSFSVHNSSMTVVNIAQLRFRLVVHPFEPGVTTLKAYLRTLMSCSLATLITIPYVLVVHLKIDQSLCVILCDEYWGKGEQAQWYRFSFSLFTTTVQFLLPLIGFEYYYKPIRDQLINLEKTHIVRHGVARQPQQQPPAQLQQQQQQQQQQQHAHQLELSEIKSSPLTSSALALNQLLPPSTSSASGHHHQQIGNHSTSNNNNNNNKNNNNNSANNINNSSSTNNNNNNAAPTTTTPPTTTTSTTTSAAATATATGGNAASRERIRQMNLLSRLKQTRKVVYFFSLTWLPLNVFNLISIWVESSTLYMYLHLVCQAAACCSVCLNPIMYPLSNDNYRQEFEHILPACLLRKLDSLLKA